LSLLGRLGDDIVHGFIDRDTAGWSNTPDWDTLGMRATQSYTTHLEGALVRPERIVRRIPAGANADPFTIAVFQNFLPSCRVCMREFLTVHYSSLWKG